MNNLNALDHLGPIADEMLAGLHADQQLKLRVKEAAMGARSRRKPAFRMAYAGVMCAALVLCCVGFGRTLLNRTEDNAPIAAQISTIAAGSSETGAVGEGVTMIADLGRGATVYSGAQDGASLFASGDSDIPLVSLDGAVYRMLSEPQVLGSSLRSDSLGTIVHTTSEPSLATEQQMKDGLSNVAAQGASVYAVKGLDSDTAVAAEVNGQMRLFQRVSYAGKGPGRQSLEDTFDVRDQIKSLSLSGTGTLEGDAANDVIDVLLDNATLQSADATARRQFLTVTLTSGLKLQLGVSGDMLCGCGGWSCPEFFEAFEAAL